MEELNKKIEDLEAENLLLKTRHKQLTSEVEEYRAMEIEIKTAFAEFQLVTKIDFSALHDTGDMISAATRLLSSLSFSKKKQQELAQIVSKMRHVLGRFTR